MGGVSTYSGDPPHRSDWTLVLRRPATLASSGIAASSAFGVPFLFAPSPFSSDLFALIAAAAPIPSASAAAAIVSLFVSLALAITAPVLAAAFAALAPIAFAIPSAFAPAVASVFASRPLAEGMLVGLS
ncbi:PTS system trehalose-specific transporter subunit IIBC [Marssonina coronariae]|uniref:PTS system trehalose-specific transporter subunit IIBC n=1 Tax=Diplocarpon coronariae TaxID=2795749 RepID=A0A218Z7D4_9HELO|nr:PTS system trehalose-specific transporter subunit IIBC [Marssonina coronariae]